MSILSTVQECILSAILFNMFMEEAIKDMQDEFNVGIKIGMQNIILFRFANYKTLF